MELGEGKYLGRRAAFVISAITALGVAGMLGMSAASATTSVTASTTVTNHPDTTSVSGGACKNGLTPNGPVWALDDYASTMTATQTGADTWQVQIHDSGKYVAFADPTTCAAQLSTGTFTFDYALTVTSAVAPTPGGLHASYDGDITTTQMVLDFFGDAPTSSDVVGGDYTATYVGGGSTYTQDTSGSSGDVGAVACTITITKPTDQTSVLNTANTQLQIVATSNYPLDGAEYSAQNLPNGLSINPTTGQITGTPTKTGTSAVTVGAASPNYSTGDTGTPSCNTTAQFDWVVSLTASSSSASNFPKGGVQTGGGKPAGSPWLPVGLGLGALALLAASAGVIGLRRQHQGR